MKPELEVVSHPIDSSIQAFRYAQDYFDAPWHYHVEFELTYITKSTGMRYVGNSIENFGEGDLVLIGASLPHAWKNGPGYQNGAASIYIQWKAETIQPILHAIPEFNAIEHLLNRARYGVHFKSTTQTKALGELLVTLPDLQGSKKIMQFLEILHRLSLISEARLLSGPAHDLLRHAKTDNRIQGIFEYIQQHYTQKISIGQMAELTCMTRSSFCKFFKNRFQKTFTRYLNEFRIHHVCQQLKETNLPVALIALNCGYDNFSYFYRQFREVIGITPAKYRQKFQTI